MTEAGDFNAWWNCWTIKGTKRSKQMARRWYQRALCWGVSHDALCDGVRRYMRHCEAHGISVRFIKHPPTWLLKGCWDDEYPDPPTEREWFAQDMPSLPQ